MRFLLLLPLLVLTGCSYGRLIYKVGDEEVHKAQITSFLGPSQTVFLLRNTNTGNVVYLNPAAGNGLVAVVASGGAVVGAAYALGSSLRPEHTTVTQTGSASSSSESEALSQAASASSLTSSSPPSSAPPTVRPPKTRPPENRPPPNRKW